MKTQRRLGKCGKILARLRRNRGATRDFLGEGKDFGMRGKKKKRRDEILRKGPKKTRLGDAR